MSTAHYLYLEAVNLGGVIADTEDLATRRAGGYMLLEMMQKIKESGKEHLEAISVGASQALFKINTTVKDAKEAVADVLQNPLYAQATVMVTASDEIPDMERAGMDFNAQREHLLALTRQKQLNSLGLCTAFEITGDGEALKASRDDIIKDHMPQKAVCELDGVRPAKVTLWPRGTKESAPSVSRSTALRRAEGRRLRQDFYARELQGLKGQGIEPGSLAFTDDFEKLSQFHPGWGQGKPSAKLEHKMAVFYADGNSFSQRARACDETTLPDFDKAVQGARRKFLAVLVTYLQKHRWGLADHPSNTDIQTARIRLETLMWGGDEFLLVLPAWLALDAVQLFFEECKIQWQGETLSHAVGLVFAHHNAPISPLQKLAKNLAEQGKQGRYKGQDSLNWIVLESFDHAGQNLDAYWQTRGLAGVAWSNMTLNPRRLQTLMQQQSLLATLPRSGIYAIVRGLKDGVQTDKNKKRLIERAYKNVHESIKDSGQLPHWQACWQALQADADIHWPADAALVPDAKHLNAWLILLELWDYLPPLSPPPENTAPSKTETATTEGATAP